MKNKLINSLLRPILEKHGDAEFINAAFSKKDYKGLIVEKGKGSESVPVGTLSIGFQQLMLIMSMIAKGKHYDVCLFRFGIDKESESLIKSAKMTLYKKGEVVFDDYLTISEE